MSPNELQNQLSTLTAVQKALPQGSPPLAECAVQTLTQNLHEGSRGITKTDGVCGGTACIARTRIPVWLLVESRRQGISEAQLLNDYPHISAADLVNAWAYAEAYPEEIETAIQQNEVA